MALENLKSSQVKEIIRSEFRLLPETHWIQNLRHPSYHLRQPIPILIERVDDAATATYDDVGLYGTGDSVKAAISGFFSCTKFFQNLPSSAAASGSALSFTICIVLRVCRPLAVTLFQLPP